MAVVYGKAKAEIVIAAAPRQPEHVELEPLDPEQVDNDPQPDEE